MPVDELRFRLAEAPALQLIDVSRPAEYSGSHIPGAINSPLSHLEERIADFDRSRATAVICASGFRSSAASSILAKHGFTKLFNIVGGMTAWSKMSGDTAAPCSTTTQARA
jgi:hydroxyacylglutathione hydrolase